MTASELHNLPIPATAEIVLEGDILPDEKRAEGPFGEWTGYYASKVREDYAVRIRRVYHRDGAIHTMARPARPPSDYSLSKCVVKAALIWEDIERAGLRGVQGVWCMEPGGGPHVQRRFDQAGLTPATPSRPFCSPPARTPRTISAGSCRGR